jgi:ABC-type transport system involved in multi-copper enzyme maturation permease subunit
MSRVILWLELRRSRSLTIWLAVVALAYSAIIGAFYPVIRDNVKLLDDYMAVFPKPLLAAFGMVGSLSDHGVFFNTYVGSMVWPIVAAIAAVILGTRTVAADVERGFIELPLATRIDRVRYLGAAIAGQIVVLAVLALATVAGLLVVGVAVNAGFDAGRFLMDVPLLFLFACAVAGLTTLLAVVTLSRGISAGVVAGGLLAMYLLDAISRIDPGLDWVGTFGFFRYLRSTSAIGQGVLPAGELALFAAIALVSWGLATWVFRRRDLVA